MINQDGYHPPDSQYIPIFSNMNWVNQYSWGYEYYHYIWYGGKIQITYNNPSTHNMWVSGSKNSLDIIHVNDAIILYCIETNKRYDVYDTHGTACYTEPRNISSVLQQGKNNIMWFGYSGPQWFRYGNTTYYEIVPLGDGVGPAYFLKLPK